MFGYLKEKDSKKVKKERRGDDESLSHSYSEAGADAPHSSLVEEGLWTSFQELSEQSGIFDLFGAPQQVADTVENVNALNNLFEQFKRFIEYGKAPGASGFGEDLLSRFEDVVGLFLGLATSTSPANMAAVVMLYGRTLYTKPFSLSLRALIKRFFDAEDDDKLKEQSGVEVRSLMDSFAHNPLRKGFASILSILLVGGLLPEHTQSGTAFHLYDLFGVRVSKQTCGATSLIELVLEVVKFSLDHVLPAVKTNDLTLLWTDKENATLDDEYNRLVGARDLLETGNISQLPELAQVETDQDYLDLLLSVRDRFVDMRSKTRVPQLVQIINAKLLVLSKLEASLYAAWKKDPIRVKPFGICISGGSGVNKTTVYEITNRALCSVNGFKCDHTTNVSLNGDDKYQSEMHPRAESVLFDDVANTNPAYMSKETNPTLKFLQFLNNAHCNALNAQAEKKGLMAINCKLVFVTTNCPDLNAPIFSCEPASILRRFELHVTVKIKPECLDPSTGMAYAHMLNASLPDCWELEVYQARIVRMGANIRDKVDMHLLLKTRSIVEYLDLVKAMSVTHFALQRRMVERASERQKEPWCLEHHFPGDACPHCPPAAQLDCGHELSAKMGNGKCLTCEMQPWIQSQEVYSLEAFLAEKTAREYVFDDALCRELAMQEGSVPSSLFLPEDGLVKQTGLEDEAWEDLPPREWWQEACVDVRVHKHRLCNFISKHRSGVIDSLLGVASIGLAFMFYRMSSSYAQVFNAQDSNPERECVREEHKSAEKPVMWRRADYVPNMRPEPSRTTTQAQLNALVARSLAHVRYWQPSDPNLIKVCNSLPVKGNVWLLPSHVFDDSDELVFEFRVPQPKSEDRIFKCILDRKSVSKVDDADLVVCVVPSSGSMPDFTRFMVAKNDKRKCSPYLTCLYNNKGDLDIFPARSTGGHEIALGKRTYNGFTYELVDRRTKRGLCGMIVVEDSRSPTLVGYHTAGKEDTPLGVASYLYSDCIADAISKLNVVGLLEQSSGPLVEQKYGIDIRYDFAVPSKSPVRFLPSEVMRNYELVGSGGKGCASMRTSVCVSPISSEIEEEMALPRLHSPPNTTKQWTSPQRVLEKITRTKEPLRPEFVRKAYEDLIESSAPYFKKAGKFAPLDYVTVINGMDGVRGMDRMDCSTSAGFPLNKPKGHFMIEVESDDKRLVVREFDEALVDVIAECNRIKEVIRKGERPNFLFQAVIKDEAVSFKKYDERKNRIFQCCEVAVVMLVREYFLELLRVEQREGFNLESGVGINASSPEFGSLYDFLAEYSETQCFAGDYAGFDTSMPLEISAMTYEYYLHFAQEAGYSEDDLKIMRGLCSEIMYPLVEYFGAWVFLPGLTPSGIPLTVHKNNNDNRGLMRYTYYLINGLDAPPFVREVRLGCYGDDNVVAVRDHSLVKFDHVLVSRTMATFGVTYTSADKSDQFPPFVEIRRLEFLKRTFRNDPDLGVVGILDEKSISKSLHLYRKNNKCLLTLPQLIAQAFEGAAREWFLYGRDVYEQRIRELERLSRLEVCGVPIARYTNFRSFDELRERYYKYSLWN